MDGSTDYYFRNIGKKEKFLNKDKTKSAIVSLVTSLLDYCNVLFYIISDEELCRLQKVQNNAARSHCTNSKRSSLAAHQETD